MTSLNDVPKGSVYKVRGYVTTQEENLKFEIDRCKEMGLVSGASVEKCHEAPIGKDPIAARVRGSLIALRRSVAALIEVEVDEGNTQNE
jgi:Fe2+ transport system protein FeoA